VKTDRPDASRMAAWMALLDAHSRLTNKLDGELERDHGLSLAEYEVLLRLSSSPGHRLRLNELTSHARMTKSGVSRLVGRMQLVGLLSTERCASDRRGAFAVLTDEGRALFRRAAALHLRGVQDHFGRYLDDGEAATLRVSLERVRDALGGPACPPVAVLEGEMVTG
jgi:DNA-binding MarR family transcriptional regulator